jgi:hypothetical protein
LNPLFRFESVRRAKFDSRRPGLEQAIGLLDDVGSTAGEGEFIQQIIRNHPRR